MDPVVQVDSPAAGPHHIGLRQLELEGAERAVPVVADVDVDHQQPAPARQYGPPTVWVPVRPLEQPARVRAVAADDELPAEPRPVVRISERVDRPPLHERPAGPRVDRDAEQPALKKL